MNPVEIIVAKRERRALTNEQIEAMVDGYHKGTIPDYQMAAFAMAILFAGMEAHEIIALTNAMKDSGRVMQWNANGRPKVDKHSTGGIGDKISIPLAPLLACVGCDVPMISGRGLGATGGTLDKLESIPGFRTNLPMEEAQRIVNKIGCVITGASTELAPADQKLYALRDVTGTVPSVPLISASILSKKLCEGLVGLVLDVKCGSGAFMKTRSAAQDLARTLVSVGNMSGVKTSALITDMNRPLGKLIGNLIEVEESLAILKNQGPNDVRELTLQLAIETMRLVLGSSEEDARNQLENSLASGTAMERFERMVAAQSGKLELMGSREVKSVLCSDSAGYVQGFDCEKIGWAVIDLGGGRRKLNDPINHCVGVEVLIDVGDSVEVGQPLFYIYTNQQASPHCRDLLQTSVHLCEAPPLVGSLILERIP
ncbi:MAG TPA: thymidine phosphorylase [Pirellulaceae bacterium]|nr:thymidine phosphorylase [Pirellulaceae bacterium]HMO92182.1 thymidine phosphorylase [Pirellulaceae bacterium]HMP68891.1 thymidine phosphorylase [Pirellulaceae bacterium]